MAAGDPLAGLLAQGLVSPAQMEALRHAFGFDLPIAEQYVRFLAGLARGDLGRSLYSARPVSDIVREQIPNSLALGGAALAIGILMGLVLGVGGGWVRHRWASRFAESLAVLSTALPVAFTGILALWLFGTLAGHAGAAAGFAGGGLLAPALVLGFASSGAIAKTLGAGLRENLTAPFLLAARAHGLGRGPRLLWHALRPSLATAISLVSLEAAFLFGGTVITETVFARPGLGRLLVGSILQGDYAVAQGIVVFAALLYTLTQVAGDLAAQWVDPRWAGPS
jgi:ABC-type dipeptide/oligopeptide/nickel transport system permease component